MAIMNIVNGIHEKKDDYEILSERPSFNINIIQGPENRKKTDNFFLFVFAACMTLFLSFFIYTICYSDINRFKELDRCGNICGQQNAKYDQWSCTGQDMTLKPIFSGSECVGEGLFSSAQPHTIFRFLNILAWKIVLVSFVPLALCLISVVLFRYATAVAVWSTLIISWFVCIFIITPVLAVIFFILTILMVCILTFNLNKIRLVTIHLREATKAIFAIKMLFYVPIGVLIILLMVLLIFTVLFFYIMTAGKLTELGHEYLIYLPDQYMVGTWIVNPIITVWIIQSIFGIRDMTVSGAITKWYSTKNQINLNDTVPTSLLVTLKNHVGTILLASLLQIIMAVPRTILKFLAQLTVMGEMIDWCMKYIDGFFTNYVYVMTATHGTSFIQSGKKAVKLLKHSTGNSISINSSCDFIIEVGQILIIGISTLAAYASFDSIYGTSPNVKIFCLLIELGIAYTFTNTILGTLKVASNTIFFCITEESLNNKETDYPYTMSLKEFVDGSNKVYMHKIQNKPLSDMSKKIVCMKVFLVIFTCCVSCILFFVSCFI